MINFFLIVERAKKKSFTLGQKKTLSNYDFGGAWKNSANWERRLGKLLTIFYSDKKKIEKKMFERKFD